MVILYYFIAICFLSAIATANDPPGHLQRVGSHRPPIEVEIREEYPNPVDFFERYMKPGIPVILKGAAKLLPNYQLWKNDGYLADHYGDWLLKVEEGKYEGSIYGRFRTMLFKSFLKRYKENEYYLIQDIIAENPMAKNISLPKSLFCGGYKEHLFRILLLFSSGSTNSALHIDAFNNMHCLLDGTKDWVMFSNEYTHLIPTLERHQAYAALDARSVDMHEYPVIQHLPWHHAFLESGDCLYIPQGWFHHVKSSDSRNMALAFWMSYMHMLTDLDDCPENLDDLDDYRSLDSFNMTKYYRARSILWTFLEGTPGLLLNRDFTSLCEDSLEGDCASLVKLLDANRDGLIIADEITNMAPEIADHDAFSNSFNDEDGDKIERETDAQKTKELKEALKMQEKGNENESDGAPEKEL